jgi:predicted aspartyl protease
MGLTFVEGVVSGPASASRVVRFLVDSGAKFSLLPPDDKRAIGLTPRRRLTFVLADGTEIERDVSECYVRLAQGEGHTPTPEILRLVLHPFNRTLQPARLHMA